MEYLGSLISVKNISLSKAFYEELFGLKIKFDFGKNIAFDCGLYLQEDFSKYLDISENEIKYKSNNFEIYFEEENFDEFISKLEKIETIEYVHSVKEFSWDNEIFVFMI